MLGIVNPVKRADAEFSTSLHISGPICKLILTQCNHYPWETRNEQLKRKHEVQQKKGEVAATDLRSSLNQEKGGSNWCTALKEHLFILHKGVFWDAIALCYGWLPTNCPANCACGSPFTMEHALSCSKGGFPSIKHNEVQDTIGSWMSRYAVMCALNPLSNHWKERPSTVPHP